MAPADGVGGGGSGAMACWEGPHLALAWSAACLMGVVVGAAMLLAPCSLPLFPFSHGHHALSVVWRAALAGAAQHKTQNTPHQRNFFVF